MAPRTINRLSSRKAMSLTTIGRHADGGSLYLSIGKDGSRKWVFLYRDRSTGKLREMGLGPAAGIKKAGISLAEARRGAGAARAQLFEGVDPIAAKRASKSPSKNITFGDFSDELLANIGSGFRNAKHRAQWEMTLKTYAAPLRPLSLQEIGTEDVLNILNPIWRPKQETALRVRGRIERVLDAAKAKGLRSGDNPARWRGHLKELLAAPNRSNRSNFAAIPFSEMPTFMRTLRMRTSLSSKALEFTILNASRTNETIGARWSEIDFQAKIWKVSAERMKAGKEHRVPLSERSIALLESIKITSDDDAFIFPGTIKGRSLSNMAMLECLRDISGKGVTVHGFRSSFRDWAGDATSHSREVIENALAHQLKSKTEAAYRRSDALERRRLLMSDWAAFLSGADLHE